MLATNGPGEVASSLQPQLSHESRLRHVVDAIDAQDAQSRYREEIKDNNVVENTSGPSSSDEERKTVTWEPNDPENPYNWNRWKKYYVVFTTMVIVINSTMGSSLPSNASPYYTKEWNITSETDKVLPISIFLVGYVFGPVIWAPLSEQYGRKWPSIVTFVMFCVWTLACAVAQSWAAFLVFRLLVGTFASAPIAIVAGMLADVYSDHRTRGQAMAAYMATTVFGPLFAPIISGFCSPTIGWRWTFWIALIFAVVSLLILGCLPETHGPTLLARRARRIRKRDPGSNVVAPHELEKMDLRQLAVRVLTRPVRMLFFELIVSASCMYLSLIYGIFYMTFQAYPIIYQDMYGLSAGVEGLTFLTIGGGALCALPVFFAWDAYLNKAQKEGRPWAKQEEYRRLPLACIGGPLFVVSMFWLGWTAKGNISFAAPMLSGIPFGMGYMLIFMALLNYLTDAYEIFAASSHAAASCSRSILGTVLPFAATTMFTRLGIAGACSLLGGMSCLLCAIPFLFIWKGERLRAGSQFCIALKEQKEEMARRAEARRQRQERAVKGAPKLEV